MTNPVVKPNPNSLNPSEWLLNQQVEEYIEYEVYIQCGSLKNKA